MPCAWATSCGNPKLDQVLRTDKLRLVGELVVEVDDGESRFTAEQLLLYSAVVGARLLGQEWLDVILRDRAADR